MKKSDIGTLVIALVIPLLVGGVSAFLSMKGMAMYGEMAKPPLSPPAWVFSVAWTILYLLMGLASYLVMSSSKDSSIKTLALSIYGIQLALNFMWSIIFFRWEEYLAAFIWLMILWCAVIICAVLFYKISKAATGLLIPYILWLTFAAYLNLGAYMLSVK